MRRCLEQKEGDISKSRNKVHRSSKEANLTSFGKASLLSWDSEYLAPIWLEQATNIVHNTSYSININKDSFTVWFIRLRYMVVEKDFIGRNGNVHWVRKAVQRHHKLKCIVTGSRRSF